MRGTEHWTKPKYRVGWRAALGIYLVLLIASHLVWAIWPDLTRATPGPAADGVVAVAEMSAEGPVPESSIDVGYQSWYSGDPDAPLVLLIHGSPGDATHFNMLGPVLAERGIDSIAVDLPGFGGSTPWVGDYSARAMARVCLALLDEMHAAGESPRRVHVLGWSNGGAVALEMSRLQPSHEVELGSNWCRTLA